VYERGPEMKSLSTRLREVDEEYAEGTRNGEASDAFLERMCGVARRCLLGGTVIG
jgi:hypothetical protein